MSKKNEVAVIEAVDQKSNTGALSDLVIPDYFVSDLGLDLGAGTEKKWEAAGSLLQASGARFAAFGLLMLSIKEEQPHGSFLPELERRGFDERNAQTAMSYARYVFSQTAPTQTRLLGMGVVKVCKLAHADPEVVEVLMENGDVVEQTSVRGLVQLLKAERRERAAIQSKLNDQLEINAGLVKKKLKSDLRADTQLVRDECLHQQALCDYGAQALLKAWNAVVDEQASAPEHQLRRDQIILAARAAAAATAKVLFEILESAGEEAAMYGSSEHMLTPEEASAWASEWETIRSGLVAKDAARFDRAQAELPRDVGRPKGSKTKAG